MKLVETAYHYREEWQYQRIYVDMETLNIHRRQNLKDKDGIIFHTEDILSQGDDGYSELWRQFGSKCVIEYVKKSSDR